MSKWSIWRDAILALVAACLITLGLLFGTAHAEHSHGQKVVPASKFKKVVGLNRKHRREARTYRKLIRSRPDAEMALQIAGIVYGQDWRHMKRCWLSEGYRNAERGQRRIVRLNTQGSGASGPAQFMPGTWRSTPFGHLDIFNVQAQAFATAWMWSRGRRGEWAGAGC